MTNEANEKPLTIARSKVGIVILGAFFFISAVIFVCWVFIGLYFLFVDRNNLSYELLIILPMFFLFSRFYYIPYKITSSYVECRYFFWKRKIEIKNIYWIHVCDFDDFAPFYKGTKEYQTILIKVSNVFMKYLCFYRFPKEEGVGKYLKARDNEINAIKKL